MSCPSLETIAAWTLDELDAEAAAAFEEHYFGCDACLEQARRMHRLVAEVGASLPTILTEPRRAALERAHPHLCRVDVQPGEQATIHLGGATAVGFWVMHAPLEGVQKVDFVARNEQGATLLELEDVPFDATRGEVVLACQVHYRALPAAGRLRVSLAATDARGTRPVGEYTLDHSFESL